MSIDQPQGVGLSPQDPTPITRFVPQDPIPCRIVMPAEVAFNIDLVKATISNLAERLGCPNCFSGATCVFQLERDFIVDRAGVVRGTHESLREG